MRFTRRTLILSALSVAAACGPAQEDSTSENGSSGAFDAMTDTIREAEQVEEINRQQKARMDAAIDETQ